MTNNIQSKKNSEETVNETTTPDLSDRLGDAHMNLLPKKKLLITMFAMSFNLFTAFCDQNSITVALSEISKDLNSEKTINWAATAALLANTVCQVLFGRLADIFGRKFILLLSISVLGIADLCCGFAQTGTQFYVFRAFAGIGFGGIQGSTMVLVSDIVTLKQRGKYQGILGSNVGMGNAIGPFLMSAFIKHSSWRNFYHMMPCLLAFQFALTWYFVDNRQNELNSVLTRLDKFKNIDYLGMFFGTASLTLLLIPLNGGGSTYAWNSVLVIVMFVVGGVSMVAFLIIESKIPKLPMIPLRLFTTTSLNLIFSSNFLYGIVYYSFQFFIPYYFQIVKGWDELHSSILLLPLVITQAAASTVAGTIISKVGHYKYVIIVGYGAWFVACCLLLLFKENTHRGVICVVLFIFGCGVGWTFQPTIVAAQAQSKKADRAVVISTRNVVRSLGGALGTAIASLIVSNGLLREITKAMDNPDDYNDIPVSYLNYLKAHIYTKVKITGVSDDQVKTVRHMYMIAIRDYFYLTIPLMGLCFISAFFVKDRGLQCIDEVPDNEKVSDKEKV
ncbi:putative MFS-type transporter M2p [[Candida] jaroonii]|uniref:MFS-type transporter M2p n=1 Tax=[Candida] jaroonii TaxID=467808 RepID=A0ACA9Y179_9ASCO|nr:putative MFS-type transporter M2p [[Candida] jaroonii]